MKRILLCLLLLNACVFAQTDGVFRLDSLQKGTRGAKGMIKTKWKFCAGDDMKWANPMFDDSKWESSPSNFSLGKAPTNTYKGIGWFRIWVVADTAFVNKTIALLLAQVGASEIYLDGKLLYKFGVIDTKDPSKEERFDPGSLP